MKVLIVNHTSVVSGAEISLLELLAGLPEDVTATVACPEGKLADAVRGLGITTTAIPEIDASFRLHPLHTPRGAAQILRAGLSVRRVAREGRADLVHANSVRAGLVACLAARFGGPPVLAHVRDCLPSTRSGNLVRNFIGGRAALIVTNSRYTAQNFCRAKFRDRIETIYNPLDLSRFDPSRLDRSAAKQRLGFSDEVPLLGVVGPITPLKGQDTALRTLAALPPQLAEARLLLIGETKFLSPAARYDDSAYFRSLERIVDDLDLGEHVSFLGERQDVPELVRALDVLLVPSWHEGFGRAVVEAMAMETAVIATEVGGTAEIIDDGANGRLLPPREPVRWAQAAHELLIDANVREKMALNGRKTVERFSRGSHVSAVVSAYQRAVGTKLDSSSRLYGDRFQHRIQAGSRRSADMIVPLLFSAFQPRSVIDIGCGSGVWLDAFLGIGVSDLVGVDGPYVSGKTLAIEPDCFLLHDLREPLRLGRTFDLAISLEVAEHLPPSRADSFVADLTALAPVVAFSAAVPYQRGEDHLNERWQSYWAAIFDKHGYKPVDLIRPRVWESAHVEWWYAQNLLVYVDTRKADLPAANNPLPLDIVHPRFLMQHAERPIGARRAIQQLRDSTERRLRKRAE